MPPPRCQYCGKAFKTLRAASHHTSLSKTCFEEWRKDLVRTDNPSPKRQKKNTAAEPDFEYHGEDLAMHSPPRMPSVEEGEDESEDTYRTSKAARFIESYPGDAGKGLRKSKTKFETWFENQTGEEKNPWAPFASEQEWALAIWLMKNVGQKSTAEFLKLQIVSILCLPFIKK